MFLLEHDAKVLLQHGGIPVPDGIVLEAGATLDEFRLPPGPWMVKAQIAAGGRGKAGLVRKAANVADVLSVSASMFGTVVTNRRVDSVRIETQIAAAEEAYAGLLVDAARGGVTVIVAEQGGVDVEQLGPGLVRSETVAPEAGQVRACVERLVAGMPARKATALVAAIDALASLFFAREALLIEINPLFILDDGGWLAGDAKIVTDDNALERQPQLGRLLQERAAAYPETWLKQQHGFDYVVVDPGGDIGLVTTGAGLSMMLIDELRAQGLRPYNFLDIRTGGFRGDPSRLVSVLRWLSEAPSVRIVLINIFAGITDLGEFAKLLVQALALAPKLQVGVVARLAGTNIEGARSVLAEAGIALHTDLPPALAELRSRMLAC